MFSTSAMLAVLIAGQDFAGDASVPGIVSADPFLSDSPSDETATPPASVEPFPGSASTSAAVPARLSDQPSDQGSAEAPATFDRPMSLDIPVLLDEAYLGEVVAEIAGDTVRVVPAALLSLIAEQLDKQTIANLRALSERQPGPVSLADLVGVGLRVEYRPQSLSLAVLLNPDQRGVRELRLRPLEGLDPAQGLQPASFSAGATILAHAAHIHTQPFRPGRWEPFRAEAFGFLHFGGFEGWNLLWSVDYDGSRMSDHFRRRHFALIKDNFENATRLTIGDFRTSPTSGFQRSVDILGINYRRAYESIQPFRSLLPRGRTSFTLERPARVRVEVDGFVAFDETLEPGAYDLRDFPFINGANEAIVTVDDGSGPRELALLSTFVDSDLLEAGVSRFDIGAGVLDNGFATRPRYEDDPVVVASFDFGLSDEVTVGGYVEGSPDLVQAGARVAIGTPIGLFAAEGGVSRSSDGWGRSAAAQYRTEFETGSWLHALTAQLAWRSDHFASLASIQDREASADFRYLVQRDTLRFSLDASWRETRFEESHSLALSTGWRMFGLNWNGRLQYVSRSNRPDDEYRGLLSVSIPLDRSTRLRARAGTDGDARLEVQRYGGYAVSDTQWRANLARDDDGLFSVGGTIRHIANRAEFEFDHQSRDTPDGWLSLSQATMAAGIGYADGALQFGRPFDAGFVIVKRHETLGDKRVSLDEAGLGVAAHSDAFGPPLVPLRSAYANYRYGVDVTDIEPGYDLGVDIIELIPPLRAGYRVDLGGDLQATLIATLTARGGEAIALATGRIFDKAGEQVARFFTNRTGRLVVEGLETGQYRIVMDGTGLQGAVAIAEGDAGLVDRGTIALEVGP